MHAYIKVSGTHSLFRKPVLNWLMCLVVAATSRPFHPTSINNIAWGYKMYRKSKTLGRSGTAKLTHKPLSISFTDLGFVPQPWRVRWSSAR